MKIHCTIHFLQDFYVQNVPTRMMSLSEKRKAIWGGKKYRETLPLIK